MGACIAAAVICAHAAQAYESYAGPINHFSDCSYCGRSPDRDQNAAQCAGCGGALKRSLHRFRSRGFSGSAESARPARKETERVSSYYFTEEEPTPSPPKSSSDDYVNPSEEKPSESPMSDMTDITNPIGIFSPIWHQ